MKGVLKDTCWAPPQRDVHVVMCKYSPLNSRSLSGQSHSSEDPIMSTTQSDSGYAATASPLFTTKAKDMTST